MASSSRSRASGSAAAAGGSLGSLSDPQLASLPAVELVVRLYNHRRASDFSDAALVLAARELRLADAEAQIRRADEKEARLVAEIRAWERRADEALLCAVRGDDDHTAAMVGEKEVVEAPEVEESPDDDRVSQMEELTPRDCTPSAVESAGGGGLAAVATLADEAGDDDDVDRLSTLSTVALLLAPTPTLQRGELAFANCELVSIVGQMGRPAQYGRIGTGLVYVRCHFSFLHFYFLSIMLSLCIFVIVQNKS